MHRERRQQAGPAVPLHHAPLGDHVLPRISPNTLSARLKSLEENGIVARRFYKDHPPRAEYRLTDKGRALGPVLKALLEWGQRHAR